MAISIVNSTGGGAINGGNVTLALGTTQSKDYVLVAVTLGTTATTALAVASSSGGAFTQIVTTIVSSRARFGVFRQVVSSASLIQQAVITGTGGSTNATSGIAHIFRGVSSTPEEVAAGSTTGASSTPNSPSVTPGSCAALGRLPFVGVTSVGLPALSSSITAPAGFLDAVTARADDTIDSSTGQAWITLQSTAAFDPAAWASSASFSWCSATVLLRPDVPQWSDNNEEGTASRISESKRVTVRSYGPTGPQFD